MAAKHARHDMREDKNFKGTDPSETTAQYLYCDNSTQRCVILTQLFTYNQKTHHGVLENTPRCAGKHINMCTKTHPTFTHLLLHTFEKYKLC